MNLSKLIAVAVVSLILLPAAGFGQHSDCGVNPQANTIQQPDGSTLTLHPLGTESVHYLESNSGYTVLYNKQNGLYEYATTDATGNLTLSGRVASDRSDAEMGKTGLQPHMRYSKTQVDLLVQYFNAQHETVQNMGKAGAKVFAPNGDRKVLVLLVQYPNLLATLPAANFEMLLNQEGNAGTGSYRDYYLHATKNRLRLTADVYGWFMADSGYKYYGKTSSPSYGTATRNLLNGAIADADSVVDFTQYDSDSDGYVDAVILIHAGIGAEEASAPNSGDYIWSFRSTLGSSSTKDGKKFSAYCMFPEKLYNGGNPIIVGIGVISHEFGHILDLPDLYSTQYNNSGAGNFTIMAAGTWLNYQKTPCIFDAYSRILLGWNTTFTIKDVGNYTIPYCVSDSNMVYRINTKKANEFFLLENRQNKGFDKYIPSRGLAVWHINTNIAGKLTTNGNNANNDTSAMGVQLLQADGLRELERNINNGNAGDLFPGINQTKKNITPFTNPSTNLQTTYQSTNISITNITLNPDSSISFRFSSQPAAAFSPDRSTGCTPLKVKLTNSSMSASKFRWDFGNGESDTVTLNPEVMFNTAGAYQIKLTVFDSSGIPSDSIVNMIQVYASPKASFTNVQNGNKITLTNTSTGATFVQWQYSIGGLDYSSTMGTLTNLTIPDTGMFTYKLIAFNDYGCADTAYGTTHAFPAGVNEEGQVLRQCEVSPNPFNQDIRIQLELNTATRIKVTMNDLLGRQVAALDEAQYAAGPQTLLIQGLAATLPGVYFIQLQSGTQSQTMRVVKTE